MHGVPFRHVIAKLIDWTLIVGVAFGAGRVTGIFTSTIVFVHQAFDLVALASLRDFRSATERLTGITTVDSSTKHSATPPA